MTGPWEGLSEKMISVKNLSLEVGEFALEDVSFEIPARAYCALMGRTGCGKTTTSRIFVPTVTLIFVFRIRPGQDLP